MKLADRIRSMVEAVPDDGAVTLPVRTLREWLEDEESVQGDLTLEEWARAYSPHDPPAVSTVRQWFAAGLVPGAYKVHGRKWMAPPSSVHAFRMLQQARHGARQAPIERETTELSPSSFVGGSRRQPDTSAWRRL